MVISSLQVVKLLFMQFSPALCHFLGSHILPSTLFSNTFNLRSSLIAKDHFSDPYKQRLKLNFLYFNL